MANKDQRPRMFSITMTQEQLELIGRMCDFAARIRLGQFSILVDEIIFNQDPRESSWESRRQAAYDVLYAGRGILFPKLGSSRGTHYGVNHDSEADALFDINDVIRHKLWELKPREERSFISVEAYKPRHWSKYPLPVVRIAVEEPTHDSDKM